MKSIFARSIVLPAMFCTQDWASCWAADTAEPDDASGIIVVDRVSTAATKLSTTEDATTKTVVSSVPPMSFLERMGSSDWSATGRGGNGGSGGGGIAVGMVADVLAGECRDSRR